MLKHAVAALLGVVLMMGLPQPTIADAGEQDPPLARPSISAWLPEAPCADDDPICAAFVAGQMYPVQGIPSSVWREARCLSVMAYHEARSEGPLGMKAVIWVALNRAHDQDLPPCRIIAAPGQFDSRSRRHLLQAARTGAMPHPIRLPPHAGADAEALAWARGLAWRILLGELPLDPTLGATYFHANYVQPHWAHRFQMTVQIGNHRFYRAPGAL